jgi:ribonuclease-3
MHSRTVVNGTEKGMGRGKNQKIAKEEAARQTYFAMNWGW